MQSSNHDFSMDGSMGAPMSHHMQYQQHHSIARHPLPAEQYNAGASFTEGDSQMLDREENEDGDSMNGTAGTIKAGTRSSANNELEMRHLFNANRHRNLQEVARELHGNERGPNSERTRQVFAMLWYAPSVNLTIVVTLLILTFLTPPGSIQFAPREKAPFLAAESMPTTPRDVLLKGSRY